MTRKHSLVTRALALVMALVLIASNGAGLTLGAKAAETKTSSLFELMQEKGCSNAELDAVLAYAYCMPELNEMNITVTYETAPTAAVGVLRHGKLTLEQIGEWTPASVILPDGSVIELAEGQLVVDDLSEEVASVNVIYKYALDINADEKVSAVHNWVSNLAGVAAQQAEKLGELSTGKKLTALKVLEGEFIYGLKSDVDGLTADNLDINLTAEDLGLTTNPADWGYTADVYDKDGDGVVDADIQALIDAAIEEEIKKATEEELNTVKTEFSAIIDKLMARLVTADDPYAVYTDYKGNPGVYVDYLRIYGMMDQYSKQGLPLYYKESASILPEMESLSAVLGEMLGVDDTEGENYKKNAMQYLLDKGEYGVEVSQIENLRNQMLEGAAVLRSLPTTVEESIDTAACEDLKALTDALAACGTVTGVASGFEMASQKLSVVDDSWRFINTTVNGEPVNIKFATGTVLGEAEIKAAVEQIAAKAPHYIVDTAAVEALLGTEMNENIPVECPAAPKAYTVNILDSEGKVAEELTVMGDATSVTLPCLKNHRITYVVNGVEQTVTEPLTITGTVDELLALSISILEDIDVSQENWDLLVSNLNNTLGRKDALVLDGDTLIANITMDELGDFADVVFDMEINTILLNGEEFLVNIENSYYIKIQTLIDALLCDTTFTSQKLIKLGDDGHGNLLNSTIEIFESEKKFVLNLPSVPSEMKTVASGLKTVEPVFWFQASGPIQGRSIDSEVAPYLNVSLDLPEKVYEAYATAALMRGDLTDGTMADLTNKIAMQFVESYVLMLLDSEADMVTLQNTLKQFGVNKNLEQFNGYYNAMEKLFNSNNFNYEIVGDSLNMDLDGTGENIEALLATLGINYMKITKNQDIIENDEKLNFTTVVTMVNKLPSYEALIVDPARLNDESRRSQIQAVNYAENLPAEMPHGPAAILLLGNVDGDLHFDDVTILDLNGFSINGSITAKDHLIIVDSSLDTVSGATVTGSVSGKVHILGGSYNADVSAYLEDGYYQEGTAVKNAMYEIINGKIVVDGNLYMDNVDGYLPAAHYLAADIAVDMVMNYYFASGLAANGDVLYSIEFHELVSMLLDKDAGALIDQVLACFHADGTSNFINTVIADLIDFGAVRDAVKNGTSLGSYTFTIYPWNVVPTVTKENTLDLCIVPSENVRKCTLDLTVKVPNSEIKNKIVKALSFLAAHVDNDETEITVTIDQPVRDKKTLVIGGSGSANITLDFSQDQKWNIMLATVLAYFNNDVADELIDDEFCVVDLNDAMSTVTVGHFFKAVKGVIENKDITIAKMIDKLNIQKIDKLANKINAADMAKLENLFQKFQTVCVKVINKFDLDTNSTAPLSELSTGDGIFTVEGDIKTHDATATVRSYGLKVVLGYSDASLTVKLAPKCTEIWGDVDRNGKVDTNDAMYILQYVTGRRTEDELHLCVADLDSNGKIDTNDAMYILQFVTGRVTKLPVK